MKHGHGYYGSRRYDTPGAVMPHGGRPACPYCHATDHSSLGKCPRWTGRTDRQNPPAQPGQVP